MCVCVCVSDLAVVCMHLCVCLRACVCVNVCVCASVRACVRVCVWSCRRMASCVSYCTLSAHASLFYFVSLLFVCSLLVKTGTKNDLGKRSRTVSEKFADFYRFRVTCLYVCCFVKRMHMPTLYILFCSN